MIKKLLIALVLVFAVSSAVPQVRRALAPPVEAVLGPVGGWVQAHLRAVPDVMLRWSAKSEARNIARRLREQALSGQALPAPDEFDRYVRATQLSGRAGYDPWGHSYFLVVSADSITVGSEGPDNERATPDDVRVSVARR